MTIKITDIHQQDAYYFQAWFMRGIVGKLQGAITDNGGWYGLTIKTKRGVEIGFAYCRFVEVTE
jgi:hypothetical protein